MACTGAGITLSDRRDRHQSRASGSRSRAWTEIPHLDNVSLLALTARPDHLMVVGGSYIGLEMGQILRRLGSQVTIVHRAERLTEREDEDVSGIIAGFLATKAWRCT